MEQAKLKSRKTKGERLGWTPIKDLKPVELTPELTKGRKKVFTTQAGPDLRPIPKHR